MKKVFILLCFLGICLSIVWADLRVPERPKPTLSDQLIPLQGTVLGEEWLKEFGGNLETVQTFNIFILTNTMKDNMQKISILEQRISELEKEIVKWADIDPNGISILPIFDPNN